MSNATKRNALAWALIAGRVIFFSISLLMSKACPGAQIFWALMLLTHMPFVALPFWAVFHGHRRTGIFLGWLMFLLGEIVVVTVAEEVKQMADNHWPIRRLGTDDLNQK